jgi:hypothetical protein
MAYLFFRVKNEDEAVALANDSDFGLGGSVCTRDIARLDRLNQQITGTGGVGKQNMHDWTIGVSKTLTLSGNIVGRIAYSNEAGGDPVAAIKATDKLVQADIAFNF